MLKSPPVELDDTVKLNLQEGIEEFLKRYRYEVAAKSGWVVWLKEAFIGMSTKHLALTTLQVLLSFPPFYPLSYHICVISMIDGLHSKFYLLSALSGLRQLLYLFYSGSSSKIVQKF
jgi:hypothetical protein